MKICVDLQLHICRFRMKSEKTMCGSIQHIPTIGRRELD